MDDLTGWLREQIETRRWLAERALKDQRTTEGRGVFIVDGELAIRPSAASDKMALHLVGCSPKVIISQCDADHAILDMFEAQPGYDLPEGVEDGRDEPERRRDEGIRDALENVVRETAGGYRHRDGYRAEWAL